MKIRKIILGTELIIAIDYKGETSIIRCKAEEENEVYRNFEKKLRGDM